MHIDKFSVIWNAFISSLREEDLISNRFAFCVSLFPFFKHASKIVFVFVSRERNLLIVPSSIGDTSVFQWPPFLLASKVHSFNLPLNELLNFLPEAVLWCSWL